MTSHLVKLQIHVLSHGLTEGKNFGETCNILAGAKFLPEIRKSLNFVKEAIAAVRSAPDADPNWTDEEIAGIIMKRIKETIGK